LIQEACLDVDGRAHDYVVAAVEALAPAAETARRAASLRSEVARRVRGELPYAVDEIVVITLCSFVADAVASQTDAMLAGHVGWLAKSGGVPRAREVLAAVLRAFEQEDPTLAGALAPLAACAVEPAAQP
jgi:hypothetical protein